MRTPTFAARLLLAALFVAHFGLSAAQAQRDRGRRPTPPAQRDRPQRPPHGETPPGRRPPGGEHPPPPARDEERPLLDRVLGAPTLHPQREDFGPLRPGEQDELLDFARDRTPRLYGMLTELRRRDPARFRENFARRILPRLRQIRRLCENTPNICDRLIEHIENQQSILRATMALRSRRVNDNERRQVLARVRGWEAANLRIEDAVMKDWIESLKSRRDELAERFIELAQDPDANLAGEPAPVRRLVERLRTAQNDEQRAALLAEARETIGRRIDDRISNLEKRLAERRKNRDRELDQRMRRYARPPGGDFERPPRAGPRDRP